MDWGQCQVWPSTLTAADLNCWMRLSNSNHHCLDERTVPIRYYRQLGSRNLCTVGGYYRTLLI